MELYEVEYEGIKVQVPEDVYKPSEDSLLLANVAKKLSVKKVLEIGCGSGLNSLLAAKNSGQVIGLDINPSAILSSQENAKLNKIENAKFFESDLFSYFKNGDIADKFDVIMFNPPYLPTNSEDKVDGNLNHAYDGGQTGRDVLDRFLGEFERYLEEKGILYLIQSSLNDFQVTDRTLKQMGFEVKTLKEISFFFEKLYLIEATK